MGLKRSNLVQFSSAFLLAKTLDSIYASFVGKKKSPIEPPPTYLAQWKHPKLMALLSLVSSGGIHGRHHMKSVATPMASLHRDLCETASSMGISTLVDHSDDTYRCY
ncbi:hypothetical protein Adt_35387 [Abeliophyllum distichum]|uniref:Uncharacterized protein n=1 Tax=Abeliophyllum distichum TaxID=126358 RepID=A0ABD1QEK2_9LAMI